MTMAPEAMLVADGIRPIPTPIQYLNIPAADPALACFLRSSTHSPWVCLVLLPSCTFHTVSKLSRLPSPVLQRTCKSPTRQHE